MKRMFDYKELNDKLNRAIPINGNGNGYVEDYINPTDYPNGTTIKLTDFLWTVPNGDDIHINGLLEIKRWDYFHCIEELTIIDDSGSIYEKWGRTIYDNNESGWNRLDNNINFDYPYATATIDKDTENPSELTRVLEEGLYLITLIDNNDYSWVPDKIAFVNVSNNPSTDSSISTPISLGINLASGESYNIMCMFSFISESSSFSIYEAKTSNTLTGTCDIVSFKVYKLA